MIQNSYDMTFIIYVNLVCPEVIIKDFVFDMVTGNFDMVTVLCISF